jgi:hypothetical protein
VSELEISDVEQSESAAYPPESSRQAKVGPLSSEVHSVNRSRNRQGGGGKSGDGRPKGKGRLEVYVDANDEASPKKRKRSEDVESVLSLSSWAETEEEPEFIAESEWVIRGVAKPAYGA